MLDDLLKTGNIVTTLALGLGAAVLAPVLVPALRPVAKSVIKAGMKAYDEAVVAFAELNETAGDIFAEARSEMVAESNGTAQSRPRGHRRASNHAS